MENKYYTPEIEELRVGFEYEEDVHGNNKWNKKIIKPTNITQVCKDLLDDIRLSEENEYTFRVKYLTKEDIEECGFVYLKEDRSELNFQKIVDDYSFYEIAYDLDEQLLTIEYYYQPEMVAEVTGHVNSAIRFKGTIKNKSELKQILKMIL